MSCCGTGTLTKQTPLSQPVQPTYQPVLLEAAPEAIQHAKLGRPVRHIPLSLLNRRKEVHAPERECLKEPRVPPRARSRTNSTRSQELSGTSQGRREGYNGYTRLHTATHPSPWGSLRAPLPTWGRSGRSWVPGHQPLGRRAWPFHRRSRTPRWKCCRLGLARTDQTHAGWGKGTVPGNPAPQHKPQARPGQL